MNYSQTHRQTNRPAKDHDRDVHDLANHPDVERSRCRPMMLGTSWRGRLITLDASEFEWPKATPASGHKLRNGGVGLSRDHLGYHPLHIEWMVFEHPLQLHHLWREFWTKFQWLPRFNPEDGHGVYVLVGDPMGKWQSVAVAHLTMWNLVRDHLSDRQTGRQESRQTDRQYHYPKIEQGNAKNKHYKETGRMGS